MYHLSSSELAHALKSNIRSKKTWKHSKRNQKRCRVYNYYTRRFFDNRYPLSIRKNLIVYGVSRAKFLQKNFLRTVVLTNSNSIHQYVLHWEKVWRSRTATWVPYFTNPVYLAAKQFNFTSKYRHDWSKFSINMAVEPLWHNPTWLDYRKPHTTLNSSFKIVLYRFMSVYTRFNWKYLFRLSRCAYHMTLAKYDLAVHKLYLTFSNTRLYINLVNLKGLNYCSLSVGLFLKFFKKKKSLKKNKLLKILLMKYIRKLLIVSEIRLIELYIKRTPVFFNELFKAFTTPIITPFLNPITRSTYNDAETNFSKNPFTINVMFFMKFKPYNSMKGHRKGRLKRKIMRRIVKANRICD